jgi:hypothetical protein
MDPILPSMPAVEAGFTGKCHHANPGLFISKGHWPTLGKSCPVLPYTRKLREAREEEHCFWNALPCLDSKLGCIIELIPLLQD